jgi:oligoendopeptidase F
MTITKRENVLMEDTWDLTPIFENDDQWWALFATASRHKELLAAYQDRLNASGSILLEALTASREASEEVGRLAYYAGLKYSENTQNGIYQGFDKEADLLATKIRQAESYMVREILDIDPARLASFVASTPGLQIYQHIFDILQDNRSHVRSREVEKLLAGMGRFLGGAATIFSALNNADLPLPSIKNEEDEQIELSQALYGRLRQSHNREVRRTAFESMMRTYGTFRNTIAATYSQQTDMSIYIAQERNWPSVIEMKVSPVLPVSAYNNLIETVHANLPLLQEYLRLRARILELEELQPYDLYVPIIRGIDREMPIDEAKETVLAALAPLGEDYIGTLARLFRSRRGDWIETEKKRSGAFSASFGGLDPYILMNWSYRFEDVFTLAHEAGHSMHSWRSEHTQPFEYHGYPMVCAETASTVNELLLAHYLLQNTTDSRVKLYIINQQLERIRQTLIRQTLFAEYERDAHALAEAGTPLTADLLCKIYGDLNQKYYGPAVTVNPLWDRECLSVPHFFSEFYVYSYALGISAATQISESIVTEGQPAVDRYLTFLASGSSDYPIELFRKTGVDFLTAGPVQKAFDRFAINLELFKELHAQL